MKKLLTLFLALCFTSVSLSAQESGTAKQGAADSVLYSTTFYFEKNQGEWIEKYEYVKVGRLLKWAKANSSALIDIKGWSDQSGTEEFNARLSFKRAKAIRSYLVQKGIDSSRITFESKGVDFEADSIKARRADVVAYVRVANKETAIPEPKEEVVVEEPKKVVEVAKEEPTEVTAVIEPTKAEDARAAEPIEEIDTQMQVEPETTPETKAEEITIADASTPTTTDSKSCFEWNYFTPRTNLLYWLGGMMNLGVEYKKPESDFGFLVNGGFSPFGDTEWNHNLGGWFVAPEVRYYFPSNDQWFVGAQLLAGGYNIKLSDTGKQGTVIGGGVMGGYTLTLSETFDMDFTLGLGYGHLKYDSYYHDDATNTNPYIEQGVSKNSILPIQAGVNLIWKIK